MIHVPEIELKSLVPTESVAAIYLCPTRDAGQHIVAACLLGSIAVQILHQEGTRTHQAHLSLQDVPQLRKLIQARAAKKSAKPGETLFVGQQAAVGVARVAHRAKFKDCKRLAM